jgi:hypothetical protein
MSFGVGNVLATTVRIWVRNLPRFLLLTVICYLPILAWFLLLQIDSVNDLAQRQFYRRLYDLHPVLLSSDAGSATWIFVAVLAAAVATCTVAQLRGERVGIGRGLATSLRCMPSLVGSAFVVRLATVGVFTAISILRWDETLMGRTSLTWLVAYQALWATLASLFVATLPAVVIERRGVVSALGRSVGLAHGNRIKVLAVVLVHQALMFGIYVLLYELMMPSPGEDYGDLERRFQLYAYVRFGVELVFVSLGAVVAAVVYERLREAREGPAPGTLDRIFE